MKLFGRIKNEDIVNQIYNKDKFQRSLTFLIGIFIVSITFNIFMIPNDIVYGVGGIGVIFKKLFNITPSIVILISSILLLILSFVTLGFDKTKNSIIGSLLFPIFVELTEFIIPYINLGNTEPLLLTIFGAALSGFGYGLIFKSGYTTGGTDILNQIVAKYFKKSIGTSMFFTDGLIIGISLFFFGMQKFMYSVVNIVIISIMTDKVILGVSQSKTFFIITDSETAVKKFIMEYLDRGVTVIEARGGYTGNYQKMIMCTIPTKEYFIFKEGIESIDPNAFFMVTDAYEVSGGRINRKDK
ncbi:MAG: YitT family protein [Tenericutes bacterium]|nr:YitT family protein [Mycoplasmatota bacterium]